MSSVMRFDTWQDSNGVARNAIIAVKDVLKTDTFSASVASGGNVAVTDLSITHTLENSSNKLILMATIGAAATSNGFGNVGSAFAVDSTLIDLGDAAGSRQRVASAAFFPSSANYNTAIHSLLSLYEPGDTSSHTYTINLIETGGGTNTLYLNRTEQDTDAIFRYRASTSFVLMEVAA